MEKENLYLIHGEDYLRHIEEKLELFWMANVLMCYIKDRADADSYLRLAYKGVRDFDERCGELFRSWGKAVRYIKSHDLADLSDLVENELIEPEHAGYVPAIIPAAPANAAASMPSASSANMPQSARRTRTMRTPTYLSMTENRPYLS